MNKLILFLLFLTLVATGLSFGNVWAHAELCAATLFVSALILTLLRVVGDSDKKAL